MASAQTKVVTPALPRVFSGWDAPESNWLPLGRTRTFHQSWYHGSDVRLGTIREIGWRIDAASSSSAVSHQLEITLSSTGKTFTTLDPVFAKNLGTATSVFRKLGKIDFPAVSRPSDPNEPSLWIKGDQPFVFTGPHLIVQVDVRTGGFAYLPDYRTDSYYQDETVPPPVHGVSGKGCGNGRLRAKTESGNWVLELSGLAPQAPGVFLIGFDHVLMLGKLPLPIDLTAAGMQGCTLNIDPFLVRTRAAGQNGLARFVLPVPATSTAPLAVHAQGMELDSSKRLGLATSNATHSLLTPKHLSNYLFNWSRDGATAEYGPFDHNVGVVLLVR